MRGSVWQRIGSGHDATSTTPPQRPSLTGVAGDVGASRSPLELQAHDHGAQEGRSRRRRRPRYRQRSELGTPDPTLTSDPLPGAASSSKTCVEEKAPVHH